MNLFYLKKKLMCVWISATFLLHIWPSGNAWLTALISSMLTVNELNSCEYEPAYISSWNWKNEDDDNIALDAGEISCSKQNEIKLFAASKLIRWSVPIFTQWKDKQRRRWDLLKQNENIHLLAWLGGKSNSSHQKKVRRSSSSVYNLLFLCLRAINNL